MAFNMHPTTTQVRTPFNGNLNPNEVYESIFNMIIKQVVRYPELANNYNFVNMFKEEGGQYGDTALYYAQDILSSREWLGDNEAQNLLALERPEDPECQGITISKFRIVKTSTDSYLSKRAWSTEDAFSTFTGIVKSLVGKTKELYENTMINTFLGTMTGDAERSDVEVPLSDITDEGEAKRRAEAMMIGEHIANLLVELKDYHRDFNTYGFMRAYNEEDIVFIWNSKYINSITKQSLPTIFNSQGLIDKFKQHVLPAKYFGNIVDSNSLPSGLTVGSNGKVKIGTGYTGGTIYAMDEDNYASGHKFAGEKLAVGDEFAPNRAYTLDEDVICKIITKDSVKYMAGFSTSTEFFNPQSLTTSNMLIWSYAEPTLMLDQPCITVHAD